MSRIEEALAKAASLNPASPPRAERVGGRGAANYRSPLPEPSLDPVLEVPEKTLVTINAPLSPMAEEYRKLKEALVKMTKRDRFDNLIAVTSATVGEGKSVTAINLAASLAQEYDHTVLLVDADLRRPMVHKYLGFEPGKGLSDCLIEGRDVSEVLVKTGIGKLVVLPAGTSVPNPAELFSSEAMRNLFMEMKGRYADRYIIVDTPPVLPFAESRSIAGIADGVLLVVKEGQPSVEQVQEALDALQNKVLGIVYNGAHMSKSSNGYYYYAK